MSDDTRSLMQAGRGELARGNAEANSLVARGRAELSTAESGPQAPLPLQDKIESEEERCECYHCGRSLDVGADVFCDVQRESVFCSLDCWNCWLKGSTEVELGLPGLIGLYERPSTFSRPADGWWKGWERVRTPSYEELVAGVRFRLRVRPGYVYKAELSRVAQEETLSLLPRFDSIVPIWSLEMRKNHRMTPQGFEHIGRLTHLCELDLNGSDSLTESALEFLHRIPSLQYLNLEECLGRMDTT